MLMAPNPNHIEDLQMILSIYNILLYAEGWRKKSNFIIYHRKKQNLTNNLILNSKEILRKHLCSRKVTAQIHAKN